MIKFRSIPELKSMWNKPNSNKDIKNQEETSNNKHEEYLDIRDKKEHDAIEKIWKELADRRRNMLENMSQSSEVENTSMKKSINKLEIFSEESSNEVTTLLDKKFQSDPQPVLKDQVENAKF